MARGREMEPQERPPSSRKAETGRGYLGSSHRPGPLVDTTYQLSGRAKEPWKCFLPLTSARAGTPEDGSKPSASMAQFLPSLCLSHWEIRDGLCLQPLGRAQMPLRLQRDPDS